MGWPWQNKMVCPGKDIKKARKSYQEVKREILWQGERDTFRTSICIKQKRC
jgi:hypothetical protein